MSFSDRIVNIYQERGFRAVRTYWLKVLRSTPEQPGGGVACCGLGAWALRNYTMAQIIAQDSHRIDSAALGRVFPNEWARRGFISGFDGCRPYTENYWYWYEHLDSRKVYQTWYKIGAETWEKLEKANLTEKLD